ncbi:hypothetical protein P8452_25341 [Trifolium repens]|nr:hypothetical protein P8452_25341 [Trifolium repens]
MPKRGVITSYGAATVTLLSTLFYRPLTTSYRSISSKFLVNINYQTLIQRKLISPKSAGKWHLLQTHG